MPSWKASTVISFGMSVLFTSNPQGLHSWTLEGVLCMCLMYLFIWFFSESLILKYTYSCHKGLCLRYNIPSICNNFHVSFHLFFDLFFFFFGCSSIFSQLHLAFDLKILLEKIFYLNKIRSTLMDIHESQS